MEFVIIFYFLSAKQRNTDIVLNQQRYNKICFHLTQSFYLHIITLETKQYWLFITQYCANVALTGNTSNKIPIMIKYCLYIEKDCLYIRNTCSETQKL